MKPKKKRFDPVQFLILHVEKIVLAIAVPLAIFIAYQGTKYKPLSWQPEELSKVADNATNTIKTSERKAVDEGVSIITYDVKATWIKAKINSEYYRTDTMWLPSLFPERIKRGKVNIFPVNDLKAQSGLGAVSVNPAMLAEIRRQSSDAPALPTTSPSAPVTLATGRLGERWAIVTGLIPVKQQLDIYVDRFASSVMPDTLRDTPMYFFYDVERAEIVSGNNEPQWEKLDFLPEYTKKSMLWTGNVLDPVDPTFLAPFVKFPMAYPLPPVTKKFGEEVVHLPMIPMLTESQISLLKDVEKITEKRRKEMFDVRSEDILQDNPFGSRERAGSGEINSGAADGNAPNRRRRTTRDQEDEDEIKPVHVDNYLFRFFDFSVAPGKSYRYRVRLYLANPNYMLAPNVLEEEDLSKEPFLITEYCTPSNVVTIPLESRVLVTDVFAVNSSQPWQEPSASIMAVHFDLEDGSEWYVEKPRVYRGSTINYKKQEALNPALEKQLSTATPSTRGSSEISSKGSSKKTTPTKTSAKPAETKKEGTKQIDVVSDVCILDIRGGEPLYKTPTVAAKLPDLKVPGRVMVLEPSGNLLLRTVNNDSTEAETIKNPTAVAGSGREYMGMGDGMNN
jgi:hypothetical protein